MKIPSGRDDRVLKYNQIFAKRMKARRQECSISQQKLANAIGVQQPAISSYESGLIFPQPQKLVAIFISFMYFVCAVARIIQIYADIGVTAFVGESPSL